MGVSDREEGWARGGGGGRREGEGGDGEGEGEGDGGRGEEFDARGLGGVSREPFMLPSN